MKKNLFILLIIFTFSINIFAQDDIKTLLENSGDLAASNQLPEAIAEMTKVIALKPADASYYLMRADLYFGLPDYKLVMQDVKKALELKPEDKQTVLTAARYMRNIRECSESLHLIDAFISKQPDADDVVYARAHSKMCLGDWIGAYEDMSRAAQLAPNNSHYRTTQIGLLSKIGYNELSADQFEQFLTVLKTNYEQAEPKTGRESFGRQIAEVYRTRAATLHAKNDEKGEFADLDEFIKYYPNAFSYKHRAQVFADHEMFDRAIDDYNKIIELMPKEAFFLIERGDIYVEAGKLEEAFKDYDAALKFDGSFTEVVEAKKKYAVAKAKNKKSVPNN